MTEYISREAVLEFVEPDARPFLAERIKSIPAADVREVKRSHWFDGACVNCGFKPKLDYEYAAVYDKWHGYAWNFCPNCGAMMEEN